ncbi:uncharacterized protein [Henckelia pumila]|uniref:uncharacterized protein n=1 Tax=Henckelia pumila TaxID=405737 RepID=UPI003C6E52BB
MKNRTLKEATRTMLADFGVSQHFWDEAVNKTCYTQNRSMINKKLGKTPYETCNGKRPMVSYFKMFSCKCYIHNNDKIHLTIFDAKLDEGIFQGYSSISKAYRVFNKRILNVQESVQVVFDQIASNDMKTDATQLTTRLQEITLEDDSKDDVQMQNRTLQSIEPNVEDQPVDDVDPVVQPVDAQETDDITTDAIPVMIDATHVKTTDPIPQVNIDDLDYRWNMNHPQDLVIGNPSNPVKIRGQVLNLFMHSSFISQVEPKKIDESLTDPSWIESMQEDPTQFARNHVWDLVPRPNHQYVIGIRWVYRNKLNEDGTVVRNKSRLVAQGFRQE